MERMVFSNDWRVGNAGVEDEERTDFDRLRELQLTVGGTGRKWVSKRRMEE